MKAGKVAFRKGVSVSSFEPIESEERVGWGVGWGARGVGGLVAVS